MNSTWRDRARPIIAAVLAATRGQSERAINRALRAAFPWGPREHHPYKIWRDEVRRQRGLKRPRRTGEDPRQLALELASASGKERQ